MAGHIFYYDYLYCKYYYLHISSINFYLYDLVILILQKGANFDKLNKTA